MSRLVSWITEYSYRKAWLVVVVVLAVAGYGLYTVFNVRQELIPDIEFPLVTVIVQVPDSQANDISQSVTVPLEERLKALDGVKSMESTTVAGLAHDRTEVISVPRVLGPLFGVLRAAPRPLWRRIAGDR